MKTNLHRFRHIVMDRSLKILLGLGLLVFISTSIEEILKDQYIKIFSVYLPVICLLIIITLSKKVPHLVKSIVLSSLFIAVGFSELLFFGHNSMAYLYFSSAVIVAVLIYGSGFGLITFGVTIISIVINLLLYMFDKIEVTTGSQTLSLELNPWLTSILTYLMLTITAYSILVIILNNLEFSVKKEHLLRTALERERESLSILNGELENAAFVDPVTGLHNNRKMMKDLSDLIEDSKKEEKDFTIHQVLIELADFADFNIKHGVSLSNELLKFYGLRLKSLSSCRVYRETGARFLVQCINEDQTVSRTTESLEELLSEPIAVGEQVFQVNYRAAEIRYPEDVLNPMLLISNLMIALHNENRRENNIIIGHSDLIVEKVQRYNVIKEQLGDALKKDEVYCLIQPRLDIRTGLITGGELLIRWENPLLGAMSPEEFIPVSEKEGFIYELTEFVLKSSQELLNNISSSHKLLAKPSFSFNISPLILHTNRMQEFINLISEFDKDINIEFELTEGIFLGKNEVVLEGIKRIQHNSISIAIDDFGTGYSNIEYLQDLEADILKIDRKFISGLPHDTRQEKIVLAIINMAKALNLYIVAEGVEYREQYDWLAARGVEEIQGFLFAKPISFEAFGALVESHDPEKWAVSCGVINPDED
ncbi:MAG: EAL domain-containing protein [Spirochaetales bacterium]|nr:EAL domain-containing protein [Spirochaetales bacterium]